MSSNQKYSAFAIGKAFAEVLGERLEDVFTATMSELSKASAEQQEQLRQFTEEVLARAERQQDSAAGGEPSAASTDESVDLQATVDELRASIASLRSELNAYKSEKSQG